MKKGGWIWIIIVVLVLVVAGFFILTNNTNNTNNKNPSQGNGSSQLTQDTFTSCQASTKTTPFGTGSYIITVYGVVNGTCHWGYSNTGFNQTQDCYYPLSDMSAATFSHLFGQDKTGTQCSSDTCKQQDALMQTYCK